MNASQNPFATGRVERLLDFDPELIGTSWKAIEEQWSELGYRACVTGHHGSGKTTFLDAMEKRLSNRGRVVRLFFNDQKNVISASDQRLLESPDAAYFLIDGDEYLGWRERRELLRVTADAEGSLFARHRSGGMPELLKLKASPEIAKVLLGRISSEWEQRLEGELEARLAKLDGNLRELWLECFDLAGFSGK